MAYQIWSNEHNGWWKPHGYGYTADRVAAGWFDGDEVLDILYRSACGSPPGQPKEEAVGVNGWPRFHLEIRRNEKGEPE